MEIKQNLKSPVAIVFLCLLVITIICFCLVNIASVFSIIGSLTFTAMFVILTWKSFLRYLVFKRRLADQKLSDAYAYAEEIGDENAIKNFSYDRKTNRKIRYEKFSQLLMPLGFLAVTICGIFLFLICTRII